MVAAVIVVADEVADLGFEVSRQIVVLQKNAVLERLIDLPQDFRTKSCLRDGLLGRGLHAQGAIY